LKDTEIHPPDSGRPETGADPQELDAAANSSRVVAIVGRPNVGKSALFNRIVRRRVAIVHEESGVTRDRLAMNVTWEEERFELIDTGGLALMDQAVAEDDIEEGIRRQVEVAIQDATVVILVVDLREGCLPLDVEVSKILHESNSTVIVAANKADEAVHDALAPEFSHLGFSVIPVSALHGRGLNELLGAVTGLLPPAGELAEIDPLRIAVVGRPNVGKSSYINRLLHDDRVIVSNVPGTTRDSVEVPFVIGKGSQVRHYRLIDTAGIRRLGKVDSVVERFSLFRTDESIERADVVVLMLDAAEGPTSQDKKIARKVLDQLRGCLLLVNKWDLAMEEKVTQKKYGEALRKELPFLGFVPIVFASATTGFNVRRCIDAMDYVAGQVQTQLTTGVLNRLLHDAFDRVQPPMVGARRLKLYYATQVGVKPIRINLYVNHRKYVSPQYQQYLIRSLRTAFGLEGAPVQLRFRSSHERKT
jgi:GTP-binding protein